MAKEIEALEDKKVWTVEELPLGKKSINCKWVFKLKYKSNGSIKQYKALFVDREDEQIEGYGYNETFVPVPR